MGKDWFLNMLLKPVLLRISTATATALVVGGDWLCATFEACGLVTDKGAALVTSYLVAVVLLCAELALEWIDRNWLRRKAVSEALGRR